MRLELDPRGPQVLGVGPADLVVRHRTHEAGPTPELGDPGGGVGDRAPRDETGGTHELLDCVGRHQVDQGHGPLLQPDLGQLLGGRQLNHVEQG